MKRVLRGFLSILCLAVLFLPSFLFAQAAKPRELKVGYPLGGSASYFWVAHRSGSFEKSGAHCAQRNTWPVIAPVPLSSTCP